MIQSPLRFQLMMAVLALGGAALVTDGDGAAPSEVLFTFEDRSIDESSGLVDLGGTVLTVNDSGSDPLVYAVDSSTGETVGRTTYTSDEVVDVEAIAEGPDGSIWVGDIGDNGAARTSVSVYRLPPVGPGDTTVEGERFDLVYRDGPHDAEALLVHPETGRLFVVTKGLFAGQVFQAPATLDPDEPNLLRPVGEAGGMVTDGAFFPDGRHAALRSYSSLSVHETRRWRSLASMALPDQEQGEGLALVEGSPWVLVSTEGAGSAVEAVALSREITRLTRPPRNPPEPRQPAAVEDEPAPADDGDRLVVIGVLGAGVVALGLYVLRRRRQSRSTT